MQRVIHFEIMANDPGNLLSFYEDIFGWRSQKYDGPNDYWLIHTGEGAGIDGGLARKPENAPPIVNTIEVENVDQYIDKVTQAGGAIATPKMVIAGVGWIVYGIDPEGNMFGMMQLDATAA